VCDFLQLTSHTVFQLLLSSNQIIAIDKEVPIVNALILRNLCEHRHKSYIATSSSAIAERARCRVG